MRYLSNNSHLHYCWRCILHIGFTLCIVFHAFRSFFLRLLVKNGNSIHSTKELKSSLQNRAFHITIIIIILYSNVQYTVLGMNNAETIT